jgi:hypothetical protein
MIEFYSKNETHVQSTREKYLECLKEVIFLSQNYSGTEDQYNDLMLKLFEIEKIVMDDEGIEGKNIVEKEENAAKKWQENGEDLFTISRILDISFQSQLLSLHKALSFEKKQEDGKIESNRPFLINELDGVILPPDKSINISEGSEQGLWQEPRFEERLMEVFQILKEENIFSDDVILTKGKVDSNMMRRESYIVVEIPKINRMILVCDQIGEATFVIYGYISPNDLLFCTKDELQKQYQGRVEKIEKISTDYWVKNLKKFLFYEDSWKNSLEDSENISQVKGEKKLSVTEIENFRRGILSEFTAEDWLKMSGKRKKFEFHGVRLIRLARIFGIEGDVFQDIEIYLRLGLKIFGDCPSILEQLNKLFEKRKFFQKSAEELSINIRNEYPQPEDWVKIVKNLRSDYKFKGIGLLALARKFGINGNPIAQVKYLLELAKKIYSDHPIILELLEKEKVEELKKSEQKSILQEKSLEDLSKGIKEIIPNIQDWINMTVLQKTDFNFASFSLRRLATIFGITGGNLLTQHYYHLQLGRKIYGDVPELINALKFYEDKNSLESMDESDLIQKIREKIPNVQDWIQMTTSERRNFVINSSIRLKMIVEKLGIQQGEQARSRYYHLQLGRKIYGDVPELLFAIDEYERNKNEMIEIKSLDNEMLKQKIKEKIGDVKNWIQMSNKEKSEFVIDDLMTLKMVATKFGVDSRIIKNRLGHLLLGKVIFGVIPELEFEIKDAEECESLAKMKPEQLKEIIIKKIGDVEKWIKYPSKNGRLKFKKNFGIGLNLLATKFGVQGDPFVSLESYFDLGRAIYGKEAVNNVLKEKPL